MRDTKSRYESHTICTIFAGGGLRDACHIHRPWRPDVAGAPSSLTGVVEIDNTSVARIEAVLNDVDRALERLRAGTYRTCQVCGTEIGEAALVDSPLLAHCPAHPELS